MQPPDPEGRRRARGSGSRLSGGFERAVEAVSRLGSALAALCLLASLGLVAYAVLMRYFANRPIPWSDELVGYLLVAVVMLAAADTHRRGEHIGVDILTDRLRPRARRLSALASQLAVLAVGAILVFEGWQTVAFTRMLGIKSTGYLEMPMEIPQAFVPLGGALLVLAALAGLVRIALGRPPVGPQVGDDTHREER